MMYWTLEYQSFGSCIAANPRLLDQAANKSKGPGDMERAKAETNAKLVETAAVRKSTTDAVLKSAGVSTTRGAPCQTMFSLRMGSLAKSYLCTSYSVRGSP